MLSVDVFGLHNYSSLSKELKDRGDWSFDNQPRLELLILGKQNYLFIQKSEWKPHGSPWDFIQWWKRRIQQSWFKKQGWKRIKSFFLYFSWVQLNQKPATHVWINPETILLILFLRNMALNLREAMRCSGWRHWCAGKQHLAESFGFFTAWLCDLDRWHSPRLIFLTP